jgi:hypothetical protein
MQVANSETFPQFDQLHGLMNGIMESSRVLKTVMTGCGS